jgi:hypothetical protein
MCLGLCAGFRDLELRCENKDQNLKYEQQESTAKTIRYENELSLNLDNNNNALFSVHTCASTSQ